MQCAIPSAIQPSSIRHSAAAVRAEGGGGDGVTALLREDDSRAGGREGEGRGEELRTRRGDSGLLRCRTGAPTALTPPTLLRPRPRRRPHRPPAAASSSRAHSPGRLPSLDSSSSPSLPAVAGLRYPPPPLSHGLPPPAVARSPSARPPAAAAPPRTAARTRRPATAPPPAISALNSAGSDGGGEEERTAPPRDRGVPRVEVRPRGRPRWPRVRASVELGVEEEEASASSSRCCWRMWSICWRTRWISASSDARSEGRWPVGSAILAAPQPQPSAAPHDSALAAEAAHRGGREKCARWNARRLR